MVKVAGELTLKLTVWPGCTLSLVAKPAMSPHALGAYHWLIGVPGSEFSQTIGFDPGPQASAARAATVGPTRTASSARTTARTSEPAQARPRSSRPSRRADNRLTDIPHPRIE